MSEIVSNNSVHFICNWSLQLCRIVVTAFLHTKMCKHLQRFWESNFDGKYFTHVSLMSFNCCTCWSDKKNENVSESHMLANKFCYVINSIKMSSVRMIPWLHSDSLLLPVTLSHSSALAALSSAASVNLSLRTVTSGLLTILLQSIGNTSTNTCFNKKGQLSLTNPRDACEKSARFT